MRLANGLRGVCPDCVRWRLLRCCTNDVWRCRVGVLRPVASSAASAWRWLSSSSSLTLLRRSPPTMTTCLRRRRAALEPAEPAGTCCLDDDDDDEEAAAAAPPPVAKSGLAARVRWLSPSRRRLCEAVACVAAAPPSRGDRAKVRAT